MLGSFLQIVTNTIPQIMTWSLWPRGFRKYLKQSKLTLQPGCWRFLTLSIRFAKVPDDPTGEAMMLGDTSGSAGLTPDSSESDEEDSDDTEQERQAKLLLLQDQV
jgi:hypothetical protein